MESWHNRALIRADPPIETTTPALIMKTLANTQSRLHHRASRPVSGAMR